MGKAVEQQATAAAELGAFGLVVHGGHLRDGEESAEGFANWRKLFDRQVDKGGFGVPILIENTAGGDHAMARTLESIDRLWSEVGDFEQAVSASTPVTPGPAVRTSSASPNGSRRSPAASTWCTGTTPATSSTPADQHANLESGHIDAAVLAEVARTAGAPIILETPADGIPGDLAYLRDHL